MYFTEFDSYTHVTESAKSFYVQAVLLSGEVVESSPIPVIGWDEVSADLAMFWSTQGPLSLWRWETRSATMIPFHQIRLVTIRWE